MEPTAPATTNGADVDPQETREWLEALDAVIAHDGADRAGALVARVAARARRAGAPVELGLSTPYVNTIAVDKQDPLPGDADRRDPGFLGPGHAHARHLGVDEIGLALHGRLFRA